MKFIALITAAAVIGFEQLVQWRYGVLGAVALVMLTVGIKKQDSMCGWIGGMILVLLIAHPVLSA
jgi:uncharacterized membrane protein YkvI